MPATLPDTFGRYQIRKKLGEGGMGTVYLAHDSEMDRDVALKVPQFDKREQQVVIERFKREARIASRLRHPGICPIYDIGCIDGVHYLTMAFIEGKELADVLADGRPWSPARAIELTMRVAEALHVLHKAGIVHRDLKPNNILLQNDGQPVLLDFGLARAVAVEAESMATKSAGQGTPSYMAPEQWHAKVEQIKPWTDVYALGVILFQLLTGQRPFPGPSFIELFGQVTTAPRPRPSEFVQGIGPALDQLCVEVLAIDPTHRPADMAQLIARLRQCQDSTPMPTQPSSQSATEMLDIPESDSCETMLTMNLRDSRTMPLPPSRRTRFSLLQLVPVAILLVIPLAAWMLWPKGSSTTSSPTQIASPTKPSELEPSFTNSIGMKFTRIEPGTFQMGSSKSDCDKVEQHLLSLALTPEKIKEYLEPEQPQHAVEITQAFYMGIYEVTQEEYEKVMKRTPSHFQSDKDGREWVRNMDTKRLPIESVSWDDAMTFIDTLNNLPEEQRHKRRYRLPTEAEWEYACRGGRAAQLFHYGDKLSHAEANFDSAHPFNATDLQPDLRRPVAVDDPKYRPNGFGLYHMHGNVYEWCSDWFDKDYYKTSPPQDPPGPQTAQERRVVRGGAWGVFAADCRSAVRLGRRPNNPAPTVGFRLVCVQSR